MDHGLGLPFEPFVSSHNEHEFHLNHELKHDVNQWLDQHLTTDRDRVGIFTLNALYKLFQDLNHPTVVLEGQGCRELSPLPIATVDVLAANDHSSNWCQDHSHSARESEVWHDSCARVRACQMSGWLRRHTHVLTTISQLNAQRVLWQKRCDRLLDWQLYEGCIESKDEAFAKGQGLDWIPDNCSECRIVSHIFEQDVTHPA